MQPEKVNSVKRVAPWLGCFLLGAMFASGVATFNMRWSLLCKIDGVLFWTALGAIGSAAAAAGAVYAGSAAVRIARIGQEEARSKDRAIAVLSAAKILIELQQVESPLRAVEIFHSSTGGSAADLRNSTMLITNITLNEPVETLGKGHLLLPLGLDRVSLDAAVAIEGLRDAVRRAKYLDEPKPKTFPELPKDIVESAKLKSDELLARLASRAWHATEKAIAMLGYALNESD